MKKSKVGFKWCVFLISTLLFLGYNTQYASANKWDAGWAEGAKSLPEGINIRATIEFNTLFVETTTQRSDVTIRVSQGGEIVYEQTVPAFEAKNICVNLSYLENGTYHLELSNQWGDHLSGDFDIQK